VAQRPPEDPLARSDCGGLEEGQRLLGGEGEGSLDISKHKPRQGRAVDMTMTISVCGWCSKRPACCRTLGSASSACVVLAI